MQAGETITAVMLPDTGSVPFVCKYHVANGVQGAARAQATASSPGRPHKGWPDSAPKPSWQLFGNFSKGSTPPQDVSNEKKAL